MGKGKKSGGGKKSKKTYHHVVTHNPRAHESVDRKLEMLKRMEVKRLERLVATQRESMEKYFTPEQRALQEQKPDVKFVLKGAARVAQQYYEDPNIKPVGPSEDLIKTYHGRMWDHEEGRVLLRLLYDLGGRLHNMADKTKRAIHTFQQCLTLDKSDRVKARYNLLRTYMDEGDAASARQLLDRFLDDRSACFMYTRALIEYISLLIEEEGSSRERCDVALEAAWKSNPFALWTLVFHGKFADVLEHADELPVDPPVGSVLEALSFFNLDSELWGETDGALAWATRLATTFGDGSPPPAEPSLTDWSQVEHDGTDAGDEDEGDEHFVIEKEAMEASKAEVKAEGEEEGESEGVVAGVTAEQEAEDMFLGMYDTACEMALEEVETMQGDDDT